MSFCGSSRGSRSSDRDRQADNCWNAAEQVPVQRWVSVLFLQDSEADEVLDMIDRDGPDAAMAYLKNWDYGEEATDAAMGRRSRL